MGNGSDWISKACKVAPSLFGASVADLVDTLYNGIYHADSRTLRHADWTSEVWIEFSVYESMATCDFNRLTQLVVLCHDRCIRCEITGAAPHYLRLAFSPRTREGKAWQRHATMESAIAAIRKEVTSC